MASCDRPHGWGTVLPTRRKRGWLSLPKRKQRQFQAIPFLPFQIYVSLLHYWALRAYAPSMDALWVLDRA
jgi:hypothetical protein